MNDWKYIIFKIENEKISIKPDGRYWETKMVDNGLLTDRSNEKIATASISPVISVMNCEKSLYSLPLRVARSTDSHSYSKNED